MAVRGWDGFWWIVRKIIWWPIVWFVTLAAGALALAVAIVMLVPMFFLWLYQGDSE